MSGWNPRWGWLMAAGVLALPRPASAVQSNAALPGSEVGPWHAVESDPAVGSVAALQELVERAEAHLRLGHPDRTVEFLGAESLPPSALGRRAMLVLGEAHLASGQGVAAATLFLRAATSADGRERGEFMARAGLAYETAGLRVDAVRAYLDGADSLPQVAPWLRLRAAGLGDDPEVAIQLLESAPPALEQMAQEARARAHLRLGDTVEAIDRFASINRYLDAARLSDHLGHDVLTRELLYAAMARVTEPEAEEAADLARERFAPSGWREYDLVARALGRHGRARDAVPLLEDWIAAGDSADVVYHLLGIMREAAGDRWGALRAWERAAASSNAARAGESEYRRIRLLVRMRRRASAMDALEAFTARFPDHDRAAWAWYLLGDLRWDAGQRAASDSAFITLSEAWPRSSNTAQARYRLAMRALLRGDSTLAIERFRSAARGVHESSRSSRYQLGVLLAATGDSTGAQAEWTDLARSDSVGYYGLVARQAVGAPPPEFTDAEPVEPSPRVRAGLDALNTLDRIGFADEAEAYVDFLINRAGWTPDDLLSLAEGLIESGRSISAIRLGWRLTRDFTLNHPRVLRIVFPYPNRDLVEAEAEEFGLDPFLVAGMIRQESAFDPDAVSRAGARGLMQLMPATARGTAGALGVSWHARFLTVADANVHLGAAHLSTLLRRYNGNVPATLAAYNAGGRPVSRWLRYPEADDPVRWIERIPYTETRGYLKTVLRNRDLYRALYGPSLVP